MAPRIKEDEIIGSPQSSIPHLRLEDVARERSRVQEDERSACRIEGSRSGSAADGTDEVRIDEVEELPVEA